ncbi:MAG: alpha-mannosidase [Mycoplasmatales bacterium]
MKREEIYFYEKLVLRVIETLREKRFEKVIDAKKILVKFDDSNSINPPIPTQGFEEVNIGYKWGSFDSYMWTKANFILPKEFVNSKIYGIFDFGRGSGGLTIGAETLLYLNNNPYSGVDKNHEEIAFTSKSNEIVLNFRSWSGVPNEHRLEELLWLQEERPEGEFHKISKIKIAKMNETINSFYYDVLALYEGYLEIKKDDSTNSMLIIEQLYKLYNKIDFNGNIKVQLEELYVPFSEELKKIKKHSNVNVTAFGQTHIDIAWLWRVKHTREKISRSFSSVLRLLDSNPEFTFFQSQPQLFSFLKKDFPDIYEQIKKYISEGRFEVDGSMWLEADCNIPSGESLIRQILYGKQFMKNEFNIESNILWLPDVFGYSWALPQILKKSEVDIFCTTKMTWNQVNRMPFNTFKWVGMDGTNITTHLVEDINFMDVTAETMKNGWDKYKDKQITNEFIYPHGWGDGGGGPTQKNIELVKRFDKIPGFPNVKYGSAKKYFNDLDQKVNTSDTYVHSWDGELYLELHRGTFTSQAKVKKSNRILENLLRKIEILHVKFYQENKFFVTSVLEDTKKVWEILLLNQFHDIIPGTSICEVYEDTHIEYEEAFELLKKIEDKLLDKYDDTEDSFMLFNSYHLEIDDSFEFKTNRKLSFYHEGRKIDSVNTENGYEVFISNVPGLSFYKIELKENLALVEERPSNNLIFNNDFYSIEFNKFGQIISYFDKKLNMEIVDEPMNQIISYEDKPLMWSAWDIDIFYENKPTPLSECDNFVVLVDTKELKIIRFEFTLLNSHLIQDIYMYNNTNRIDFKTKINWKEHEQLLRVVFPTKIRSIKATFDIQNGNVERPTHRNTSWDMARFEVVGHKWADLSNETYGVSLLNDCKYGYNAFENKLGLTLIKSGISPDPMQDFGEHEFTYSFYVHENSCLNSDIERESFKLNNKLMPIFKEVDTKQIMRFSNKNISIDAIKPSEDLEGIIIRLHENGNKSVRLDTNLKEYEEVNLLERKTDEKSNGFINPYEIKTLKIKEKLWN